MVLYDVRDLSSFYLLNYHLWISFSVVQNGCRSSQHCVPILSRMKDKRIEKWILKTLLGKNSIYLFHLHFFDQNLAPWSHLGARETGKQSLFQDDKNAAKYPRLYYRAEKTKEIFGNSNWSPCHAQYVCRDHWSRDPYDPYYGFFFFSSGGETVYPLKKGYTAQFDLTPSFSWILKSLYLTSKNDWSLHNPGTSRWWWQTPQMPTAIWWKTST